VDAVKTLLLSPCVAKLPAENLVELNILDGVTFFQVNEARLKNFGFFACKTVWVVKNAKNH